MDDKQLLRAHHYFSARAERYMTGVRQVFKQQRRKMRVKKLTKVEKKKEYKRLWNLRRKKEQDELRKDLDISSQRLTATQAKAVEDSKKIAKDLGNKIKEDAEKIAVVFTISDTDLLAVGVKAMAKIDANALPEHHSMRFPFLIMADFPALYLWNASPKTQMLLAAYGGNYKRTGAGFKTTKRTQEQILKQSGAAETKIFCDKLIGLNFPETLVDKEHLNEGCKTVTDAMWLYGLSDSLASVALPPYGLPMYKTLMSGEMKWILFEIKSLKESIKKTYLRDGDVHTYNMEDLIDEIIPNLTAELMRSLVENEAKIYCCSQTAKESIFVPAGWIAAECVTSGVLVYGIRKTCIYNSESHTASYSSLVETYKAGGRNTLQMEKALTDMSSS